jgi:hypothetical protein
VSDSISLELLALTLRAIPQHQARIRSNFELDRPAWNLSFHTPEEG